MLAGDLRSFFDPLFISLMNSTELKRQDELHMFRTSRSYFTNLSITQI